MPHAIVTRTRAFLNSHTALIRNGGKGLRCFATGQRRSHKQQSTLEILQERGLIKDIAGDRDALDRLLTSKRIGAYSGIDPTAPSLHLGHLLPLMVLFWLHAHGHHTTSLIGGATSQVGDPTGRLTSRQAMQASVHRTNVQSMLQQVQGIWDNAQKRAEKHGHMRNGLDDRKELGSRLQIRNNATWIGQLGLLDFLKYMGTAARMGTMLGRDTVKNKLTQGDGMSFAEFTYPLLQAWDWWYMYKDTGVVLQVGGSDQYGNIIAGMDAISHIASHHPEELPSQVDTGSASSIPQPAGLTVPLLTTSSGAKFGKSAGNAVWLNKAMTSSFDLYGYLLRSSDADVERYLKSFTFVPLKDIAETMEAHGKDPGQRRPQHLLAREVLALVHGEEEAIRTAEEHRTMRRPTLDALKNESDKVANTVETNLTAGSERVKLPWSLVQNTPMSRVLYHAGITNTRSEGLRLIQKGGAYAGAVGENGELDFSPLHNETAEKYMADQSLLILRVGKWKVRSVEVMDDEAFEAAGLSAPGWDQFKAARESR